MFFFDHLENSFFKKSSVLLEPVLSFGAVGEALTYYSDFSQSLKNLMRGGDKGGDVSVMSLWLSTLYILPVEQSG